MAYVFDPTTNTLIDDEDKSLGNKLGLMDGGRVNFANGNPNFTAAAKAANEAQKLKGLQAYIDNFGIEVLNKIFSSSSTLPEHFFSFISPLAKVANPVES